MGVIDLFERDMTPSEFGRMEAGFDENAITNGIELQSSVRFGFVAMDGEKFIGCVSGLAYKNGQELNGWFYLTDLFIEQEYRMRGIGSRLLLTLEKKLLEEGIRKIWTFTAGYEAPMFYKSLGYETFVELENYYSNGTGQIGLRKDLDR